MYTVYMHITPSGKRYIGITGNAVKSRCGCNGSMYRNQLFGRAIKKYGWSNIKHRIVKSNLTMEQAKQLEIDLIAKYQATDPRFGYNISDGGFMPSEKTRNQISAKVSELWKTKEYRDKQMRRVVSVETRKRLSEAHMGKKHSEEQKEKIRIGNLGKHQSEETKKRLSEIVKKQHELERSLGIKRKHAKTTAVKGTKWYNNGVINIRSHDECPAGFVAGRLPRKQTNPYGE